MVRRLLRLLCRHRYVHLKRRAEALPRESYDFLRDEPVWGVFYVQCARCGRDVTKRLKPPPPPRPLRTLHHIASSSSSAHSHRSLQEEAARMDSFIEGDRRTQRHARSCRVGWTSLKDCLGSCRCWCHGVTLHPDGSLRADAPPLESAEELEEEGEGEEEWPPSLEETARRAAEHSESVRPFVAGEEKEAEQGEESSAHSELELCSGTPLPPHVKGSRPESCSVCRQWQEGRVVETREGGFSIDSLEGKLDAALEQWSRGFHSGWRMRVDERQVVGTFTTRQVASRITDTVMDHYAPLIDWIRRTSPHLPGCALRDEAKWDVCDCGLHEALEATVNRIRSS